MAELEATLFPIVSTINTYLSNYILVFLLIGVGLWYSIRTRFVQIRCFGEGMKKTFASLSLRGVDCAVVRQDLPKWRKEKRKGSTIDLKGVKQALEASFQTAPNQG